MEAPEGTQPVHVGGCAGCDSGQPDVRSSPQAGQAHPGEVWGCQGISCSEKTKIRVSIPGHLNWWSVNCLVWHQVLSRSCSSRTSDVCSTSQANSSCTGSESAQHLHGSMHLRSLLPLPGVPAPSPPTLHDLLNTESISSTHPPTSQIWSYHPQKSLSTFLVFHIFHFLLWVNICTGSLISFILDRGPWESDQVLYTFVLTTVPGLSALNDYPINAYWVNHCLYCCLAYSMES